MKKKNQTSHTNRYILLGLSVFCALMMVLSSFSDKATGPFKVLANVTVIPLRQGINHVGGWLGDMKDNFSTMKRYALKMKICRNRLMHLPVRTIIFRKSGMSMNACRNFMNSIRIMPNMRRLQDML